MKATRWLLRLMLALALVRSSFASIPKADDLQSFRRVRTLHETDLICVDARVPSFRFSVVHLQLSVLYFHPDDQGSTLMLTDANGVRTDQFAYTPSGHLSTRTGTTQTPYTWLGGLAVRDEGSALYYMLNRTYSADQKRFLSEDPAGLDSFPNLYAYANANPAFFTDPYGLGVKPGFLSNVGRGALLGDYGGDTGFGGVIGQTAVGFVPIAGQVADARDSVAAIQAFGDGGWKRWQTYANAAAVGAAWIPALDFLKGGKNVVKNLDEVAPVARNVAAKSEVTALTKFYPENAGFAGATERTFLMPGQTIDRYGGSGVSRFFSPQGTADWARSLPPGTTGQPLRTFEVVKPFEVQSGTVAPWFNQPGGGLQYRSPVQLEILLKRGIIKEVTP